MIINLVVHQRPVNQTRPAEGLAAQVVGTVVFAVTLVLSGDRCESSCSSSSFSDPHGIEDTGRGGRAGSGYRPSLAANPVARRARRVTAARTASSVPTTRTTERARVTAV
jgi:hypothetical protein